MKIRWLLQSSDRLIHEIDKEYLILNFMKEKLSDFGIVKDNNIFTGIENFDEDVFIARGTIKMIRIINNDMINNFSDSLKMKLKHAISYNELNFDQAYYQNLNLPLLNQGAEILNIKENLFINFGIDKFVKPTTDLKAFAAGILEARIPLKTYIENNSPRKDYFEEKFMVSNLAKIDEEYRFFCIKDKIIAGSLYAKNGKFYKSSIVPFEVKSVAEEYVKLYQPADIFVMDIAKSQADYKIVEYNCWNASGLYEVDKLKLFSEVRDYYINK